MQLKVSDEVPYVGGFAEKNVVEFASKQACHSIISTQQHSHPQTLCTFGCNLVTGAGVSRFILIIVKL